MATTRNNNRPTWDVVVGALWGILVLGAFHVLTYILDRMDRVFDRVSEVEKQTAEHEGWIEAQKDGGE